MKASLPSVALAVTFALLGNALLLSGLIHYANDTAYWDVQYRALASALAEQGDLPLWYPVAGNGFPHLNLQWVSWVFNPFGVLLALIRPYDYLSLAVENLIWRTIGFAGAFVFARQWAGNSLGATAIAITYVGSGTMSWAALSYSALIGQMFAPWILASGSLAIRASSIPALTRATGMLGLAAGLMVWCAYPGAWLTAPVLSGPILIGLAVVHPGGIRRLVPATILAILIVVMLISLIVSETTSLALIEGSIIYSRVGTAMREGMLRGIDLAGLILANPSYLPRVSSPLILPLYSGVLPVAVLTSLLGARRCGAAFSAALAALVLSLVMASTQNWTLWDHPLFREVPALQDLTQAFGSPVLLMTIALPVGISGALWGQRLSLTRVEWVMIAGMSWVLLVSGDNPIADFLRFNVPPFVLVRYNHLYFWLVTLLASTLTWRIIERITSATTLGDLVPPSVRTWGFRVVAVGASCLVVASLVAMATPDAYGLGAPANGVSAMGSPHLAWQATILVIGATTGYLALRATSGSRTLTAGWAWTALAWSSVIAFAAACAAGFAFRRAGITPATVPITFEWQLVLDIAHGGVITAASAVAFAKAPTQSALRTAIAAIMVFDVSLAVPRYFSDNDTVGASQPGWPFPPYQQGHGGAQFLPRRDGDVKGDFALPFEGIAGSTRIHGAFSPPPPVTRLRTDWGRLYETWVHFPSSWSRTSETEVLVTRDSLADSASPVGCSPGKAPSGAVHLLLASRVESTFTADCDRLLVFTDSWAPGWSATIDGVPTPVLRVNNAIRGVMVPAGEHALQWRYRPRFLAPLLALLAAGLAISGILIAAPWWSRRFPLPHRLDQLFGFGPLPPDEIRFPMLAPLPNTPVPAISPASTDAPARDWQRLPAMWRHGLPIALPLTGLAILVLASVTAYDPRIDGPTQGFRLFLFRSVLAGLWAWIVIAGRTGFRSAVGPSLMLLVLLPPLALQVAKHTYPIQAGTPLATIATDFRSPSWQDTWEVTRRGSPTIETGPSGTILRNDGATATAITFATKPIAAEIWPWWRRPLGKIGPGPLDVAWTAMLDRSGPYYTVATLGRLTIQALKNGYLVTAPVPGGDVRGDFVEVPDTGQPGPVRWLLRIEPDAGASLSLDDRQVWKGGHPGVIERITLGDASNDPEHRGSMTVTDASIVQRVALTAQ